MGLTFAIRDDDTCYFTQPEQIERLYSGIWDVCPISLAVVPFHASTRSGALPVEHRSGDDVFPLGENRALVEFLREQIVRGRLHVMLHGYSHKDEPSGFEFQAGSDLAEKIRRGRRYLEDLLGSRVTAFVPPHNALSHEGFIAVRDSGLLLCGRTDRRIQRAGPQDMLRFLFVRSRERLRGRDHPHVIRYSGHREIGGRAFTPSIALPSFLREIDDCRRSNGVFVLATHYWEFEAPMKTDPSLTLATAFQSVWRHVTSLPDVRFAAVGDL